MSKTPKTLGLPVNQMTLAASDGDLHLGVPDGRGRSSDRQVGKVASWAVGFERLLEDATGIEYFTAFLKSEVSAENILFWQACEKFQKIPANQKGELKREARFIYDEYLSNNAFHAINIDDTARIDEKDLEDPKPDMFQKAQQQIFKLMKFDSYTRFVRSPMYQSCMLADVEGRSLPDPKNPGSTKNASLDRSSTGDGKKLQKKAAAKLRQSLPFDVEDGSDQKKGLESRMGRDKRGETRGSWGEVSERGVSRNESQCSVKSTGSAESKVENGSSSPREAARVEKYCCVYLPDGTASLAPARSGLMIREMLTSLCEKRGFALSDVVIYLQGKDKQPLSLDQDSSVLKDQQVFLELRVKITLEVVFTGVTTGIVVKSSKTLLDALSSVLQKHNLRPQDVVVTTSEKKEPVNLTTSVFSLSGKKLQLDRVHGTDQSSFPTPRVRASAPQEKAAGLLDLLSRASCQVDDQRGLLTKEHLVLPDFLQLPKQKEVGSRQEQSARGSTRPAEEPAASPAVAAAAAATPAPQVATDSSSCSKSRPQSIYKSPRGAAPADTRPGCPPSCTDSSRETAV
ncbi:regulator of G-protein signaling 14-like isoform X2 [Brienomyrus brachyistius]|uniref:regulator of G-protein signaling 14-like isoform X2 n=1 Tax=Brienomyrus brachyistius TaxID=42636 RepID=UPI0020B29423|nr:regulator of G-protein signaling 14-like isoform X2 [Brienomyrus brachyistius]